MTAGRGAIATVAHTFRRYDQVAPQHHRIAPRFVTRQLHTSTQCSRFYIPKTTASRATKPNGDRYRDLSNTTTPSSYFRGTRILHEIATHTRIAPIGLSPDAQTSGSKPGARPSTWEISLRASYRTFKQAVIQRDHSEVHSKLPKDYPRLTLGT